MVRKGDVVCGPGFDDIMLFVVNYVHPSGLMDVTFIDAGESTGLQVLGSAAIKSDEFIIGNIFYHVEDTLSNAYVSGNNGPASVERHKCFCTTFDVVNFGCRCNGI